MRAALQHSASIVFLLTILARPAAAGLDRWTPLGPDGGAIWSLAADPDRPGTLYAGTTGGGVWKSTDGGGHWSPTPEGLGGAAPFSLGVSPGRVWAASNSGLFVLTEGAPAWRSASPTPDGFYRLAVDPANPDRIWATSVSSGLVWLSEDGGNDWWSPLHIAFPFAVLAISPTTPPTVYAGGSEGLFASNDLGETWRQTPPTDAYVLALDPEDPAILFAQTGSGLWRSADLGRSGSYLDDGFSSAPLLVLPGALLRGDLGLQRSEDDGATWTQVTQLGRPIVRSLAADPFTPGGAWLGTEGQGVFRSVDGGRTWMTSRQGLGASDIFAFAFDPFRPRTLYTATLAGFQRSVDGGASWSRLVDRRALNTNALAADPRQPGLLYAATYGGVYLSRDRGAHWQRSLKQPDIHTVAVDPLRPGVVYAAGTKAWRSQNGGLTWKRLQNPVLPGTVGVRFAFSPHHPGTLYLFDGANSGFYPSTLSRSVDGGNTWQRIFTNGPSALAFDPRVPDLLYLTTGYGSLYKSGDGGVTWDLVNPGIGGDVNLQPTVLLGDPVDPSILYAGSAGNGVWRSTDQGLTWEPLTKGMIAPTIACLEADPRDRHHLIACTWGGGLLEIRLDS